MTDQTAPDDLVERLARLIEKRKVFVEVREKMNAAIPAIDATPAERALYDERYKADHEAEREMFRESLEFAMWAADNEAAARIKELTAEVESSTALAATYKDQLDLFLSLKIAAEARATKAEEALRLAQPIVESDFCQAQEHCDADWEGLSRAALDAIGEALGEGKA